MEVCKPTYTAHENEQPTRRAGHSWVGNRNPPKQMLSSKGTASSEVIDACCAMTCAKCIIFCRPEPTPQQSTYQLLCYYVMTQTRQLAKLQQGPCMDRRLLFSFFLGMQHEQYRLVGSGENIGTTWTLVDLHIRTPGGSARGRPRWSRSLREGASTSPPLSLRTSARA